MSKEIRVFTCGTDPEFMLRNKKGLVSAIGILEEGDVEMKSGSTLRYDNVNVEFATKVAGSVNDFVKKITDTFKELNELLPTQHTLVCNASATYKDSELNHPDAYSFGCEEDYNAWTLEVNDPPDTSKNPNLRSCGGHLHIGQKKGYEFLQTPEGKIILVQVMDALLGIISVKLDNTFDSRKRRVLYGKAGCHRPTDYGVEYRTMSNFWLKSPFLVRLMHSLASDALNIVDMRLEDKLLDEVGIDNIQDIINRSLPLESERVIKDILPSYLSKKSKMLLRKCTRSMKNIELTSLEHNWKLPYKSIEGRA